MTGPRRSGRATHGRPQCAESAERLPTVQARDHGAASSLSSSPGHLRLGP
jgi:hypothetical protein